MDHSNYIVTELFKGKASDFGAWSGLTPGHVNMIYHQVSIASSGVLAAGIYNVRIIVGEDNTELEGTAYTGKQLTIAGVDSVAVSFVGAMRGMHLEISTPLSSGQTISCVLASSIEPMGDLVVSQVA